MMTQKTITAFVLALIFAVSATACSSEKSENKKDDEPYVETPKIVTSDGTIIEDIIVKSDGNVAPAQPIGKGGRDTKLTPDVSSVNVPAASTSVVYSKTEEECIGRLGSFCNPNGNAYDALALLGQFRYSHKTESERDEQLSTASKTWHDEIVTFVGDKCITTLSVIEKTPIELSNQKAKDWANSSSANLEAYSNVKVVVSTNYSSEELILSIDLVKVDGYWYLAKTSTLDKMKTTITKDIFR